MHYYNFILFRCFYFNIILLEFIINEINQIYFIIIHFLIFIWL